MKRLRNIGRLVGLYLLGLPIGSLLLAACTVLGMVSGTTLHDIREGWLIWMNGIAVCTEQHISNIMNRK